MSADSTNYYFVNGLMEASLYNLQKIGDLRVVSRTSVEKYRDGGETASKIAEELKVTYLVEGSGQKINDEILLNIQLIDTRIDSPIWTERYQYKLEDVFTLQNTIAKQIALAVEANITPEELAQIDKTHHRIYEWRRLGDKWVFSTCWWIWDRQYYVRQR